MPQNAVRNGYNLGKPPAWAGSKEKENSKMFTKSVKPEFEYAGHGIGLKFKESEGEWFLITFSMSSREIEGGIYPRHFAEGEAIDAITNLTMDDKSVNVSELKSVKASVQNAIARLIANGTFQAVN